MKALLGLILVASLFSISAQAAPEICRKNEADQSVKTICFLLNKEGRAKGFLLFNANGTRSYLAVTRTTESGYGEQEYGRRVLTYTVKISDASLTPTDTSISQIRVTQTWQYSDGQSVLQGTTPGGRKLLAVIESGDSSHR